MIDLKKRIANLPKTDNRREESIIRIRLKFKRHGIIWTDEEDDILNLLYQKKLSESEISKLLERTENALKLRIELRKLTYLTKSKLEPQSPTVSLADPHNLITPNSLTNKPKKDVIDFKNRAPELNVLHYWRTSLADESKLGLSTQAMKNGKNFSQAQFTLGKLPPEEIKIFFINAEKEWRKKNKFAKDSEEDINIQELPVIIAPLTAVKKYEHGREQGISSIREVLPLWLTATLTRDGLLRPDEENASYP